MPAQLGEQQARLAKLAQRIPEWRTRWDAWVAAGGELLAELNGLEGEIQATGQATLQIAQTASRADQAEHPELEHSTYGAHFVRMWRQIGGENKALDALPAIAELPYFLREHVRKSCPFLYHSGQSYKHFVATRMGNDPQGLG